MTRWHLAPGSVLFAVFLGALAALPPISIDMALPALGQIASALHASAGETGLTLSVFMAGFAAGPIAYGPLSDAHGRKPTLLVGLALFTLGGIAAVCAPGIGMLLGARLLQGLGAGAGMTIALAIVRDLFDGHAMQRRLATITVVANVAPIVAPSIGVGLMRMIDWRGIYAVMAACGLLAAMLTALGLTESAPRHHRDARHARNTSHTASIKPYRAVLTNRAAMGHILINGFGFGWMFAYVAGSPLVLLREQHVSPSLYAALFAMTGGGIVAGAALSGALVSRAIAPRRLLAVAIGATLVATLALSALGLSHHASVGRMMPLLVTSTFCFGLAAPGAARGALEPLPHAAGVAGGLLTSIQMLCGAASSSLVAALFPALGLLAMSGVMSACAVLAAAVWVWLGSGVTSAAAANAIH